MGSLNTLFPNQSPKFEPHITISTNINVDLEHPDKTKDDVYKILSSSLAAVNSLPRNHSNLVTLGKVDNQRKYFKKLYFQVARDPNLVSFATIIRELFVILPTDIEQENIIKNPHMYTTDSHGNKIKKKPKHQSNSPETETRVEELDMARIQREAQEKASQWSVSEFDPHLSLVYSTLFPIDNALWRTIKTRIQDYLNIDNCDSNDLTDNGLGWDSGELKLVLCEGDVNDWVVLGSADLH